MQEGARSDGINHAINLLYFLFLKATLLHLDLFDPKF